MKQRENSLNNKIFKIKTRRTKRKMNKKYLRNYNQENQKQMRMKNNKKLRSIIVKYLQRFKNNKQI